MWNERTDSLQEQLRANRFELEENLGQKLQLTMPIGSWLVRHFCWQLFRFLYTPSAITQALNVYMDVCMLDPLYLLEKSYLREFMMILLFVFIATQSGTEGGNLVCGLEIQR